MPHIKKVRTFRDSVVNGLLCVLYHQKYLHSLHCMLLNETTAIVI